MNNGNLIQNGHFDEGLNHWESDYGDFAAVTYASERVGHYILVGPSSIAYPPLAGCFYQYVDIESGVDYMLTFKTTASENGRVAICARHIDTGNVCVLWEMKIPFAPEVNRWTTQRANFTLATEGYKNISLKFISGIANSLYVTEVILMKK